LSAETIESAAIRVKSDAFKAGQTERRPTSISQLFTEDLW